MALKTATISGLKEKIDTRYRALAEAEKSLNQHTMFNGLPLGSAFVKQKKVHAFIAFPDIFTRKIVSKVNGISHVGLYDEGCTE